MQELEKRKQGINQTLQTFEKRRQELKRRK